MPVHRGRLREADYTKIQKNYVFLLRELDGRFLVNDMFASRVFTLDDKQEIDEEHSRDRRTLMFLQKLLDSGPSRAYNVFLRALQIHYPHVAEVLVDQDKEERKDILAEDEIPDISNEEVMKRVRNIFTYFVIPANVLHLFHKYDINVLGKSHMEEVDKATIQKGDMAGARLLLDRLSKYKHWYSCLLNVLNDSVVQMSHVAKMMEVVLGHTTAIGDVMIDIDHNQELVNKIRHIFMEFVKPASVMHLFHKHDLKVLVRSDIEEVDKATIQKGDVAGARLLLDRLSKYKHWYSCLLNVLNDSMVQMSHVARMMESVLGHTTDIDAVMIDIFHNQEMVNKIRHIFIEFVKPAYVMRLFHKYDLKVLVRSDIELIDCERESLCAGALLLDRLSKYKDWYPTLLKVLKDSMVEMNFVAIKMELLLGHRLEFEPFRDIDFNDLPQIKNVSVDLLQRACDLVVRVDIKSKLGDQQQELQTPKGDAVKDNYGTGMVTKVYRKFEETSGSCPCRECRMSQEPQMSKKQWAEFGVQTASRVMSNDEACERTTCTVFYDQEDTDTCTLAKLVGVELKDRKPDKGYCELSCITHDKLLAENLTKKVTRWKESHNKAKKNRSTASGEREVCVVVAHPDGLSKRVSVGEVVSEDTLKITYNSGTGKNCCGAPVFLFKEGNFTGQTIHNWQNDSGENESIDIVIRFD